MLSRSFRKPSCRNHLGVFVDVAHAESLRISAVERSSRSRLHVTQSGIQDAPRL